MSRLIVKNLPHKVNPDKLKQTFCKFGEITDVQLKVTPDGRFRKFAFVGFRTRDEAREALEYFNGSYFDASKLTVEFCHELGSTDKPKSWSKLSSEKSIPLDKSKELKSLESSKNTKLTLGNEVRDKILEHTDDPEFSEFLKIHGGEKILEKHLNWSSEDPEKLDPAEDSIQDDSIKPANASISDIEYLKLKTKGKSVVAEKIDGSQEKNTKTRKFENFYTIKIRNLPAKIKKKEIKVLFKPLKPASIRRTPSNSTCIAFVGFKTEKELRKSLIKNKTFVRGKQITIVQCFEKNSAEKVNSKWEEQENSLKNEEGIAESGRIFVRNLPYTVKESELEDLFSKYGPITEVIVPIDPVTRKGKGFGIVTFLMPEHAVKAYTGLDGSIFQGRMLHLLPGKSKTDEIEQSGHGYKSKKEAELKASASSSHNWNSLFLGQNAVVDTIAETYSTEKAAVLTGSEGGVRLALGETQLVTATREFLAANGVQLDAFNSPSQKRSKTVMLVKNLPAKTTSEEINEIFQKFGVLKRTVLPPGGITALVEFEEPSEARAALKKLAYTKFKNLPLYLEWAPDNSFIEDHSKNEKQLPNTALGNTVHSQDTINEEDEIPEEDTTIFVKNLNFNTTEDDLRLHFQKFGRLAQVSIAKKKDTKIPGSFISMGYGFVQYFLRSCTNRALAELQGSELLGYNLELKRSTKTLVTKPVVPRKISNIGKQTGSKILVRNIPFQASKKEITQLFKTFGELKTVRLPKKLVGTGSHRGFAFIEYNAKNDAKQAMTALSQSTHLYGRRLVLEWAEEEEDNIDTLRKRTALHYHPEEVKRSKKGVADIDIGVDDDDI